MSNRKQGSLVMDDCRLHSDPMTSDTQGYIKSADKVLAVAPNPLSIQHIPQLNPKAKKKLATQSSEWKGLSSNATINSNNDIGSFNQ